MKEAFRLIFKFIRYFVIAGIGPVVVTTFLVAFVGVYWGPGLLMIGVALIMILVNGVVGLVINQVLIYKKRTPLIRIICTGAFALLLGSGLLIYQFSVSTPEKLKTSILVEELRNQFKAVSGRLFYIGLEYEVYVELESTPELTKKFLGSRAYELKEQEENSEFQFRPDWFPNKIHPKYKMYESVDFDTEQLDIAIISQDSTVIYGFYLAY